VIVEETHMSWVFLVADRVYKLKKPVRYPFLDLATISCSPTGAVDTWATTTW
jgi:uncharacterized protein